MVCVGDQVPLDPVGELKVQNVVRSVGGVVLE
jgi:hypothetical protein